MYLNPYLTFDGNCEEAFNFYASCLGGEIEAMLRHGDAPGCDQVPSEWHGKVMHACLRVAGQALLGADAPPTFRQPIQGCSVAIAVEDPAEAERIFRALEEGGSVQVPMQETFWAKRFGALTDRFGVPWMINCSECKPADADAGGAVA